ncbi:enoyl-CoA hydratase/isomerase family protein [Dyella sp. A6]|uniref:enoyl-CoA hydratase/isomerase family protein n=1 Tax=Dyella aluminiiresistens TaxID=3069105 RepID=UPI002E79747D|nr:enoyl-CoA hydratase/isomerase family protein [Dyella sp. A6]
MLDIIRHEAVTEIRLARPPVNALDLELLRKLRESIDQAVQSGARGIILSGAPGMFSAGVDVPALLSQDRAGVHAFWRSFFETCSTLARSPIPVVAAISGHSPAGGAVLALFCDYRVMAEGAYKIGLNEVQVGLTVPDCIQFALRRVVGTYRAERLLVAGAMIDAAEALRCGFVDEITAVDLVVTRARVWLDDLLKRPSHAMLATRRIARADLVDVWANVDALPIDDFVEGFFHPQTQTTLQGLVAKLKSKSS